MSYSEPLINQVRVFLLSIGMGVPVCLIYIVLKSIFAFFGKKKQAIYASDILFCSLSTFVSFFFMVFYNNGMVRLHLIIGEAVGFFVFYFSVGKYLLDLGQKAFTLLSRAAGFVLYPFLRVFKAFGNIRYLLWQGVSVFSSAFKGHKAKKTEEEKVENKRKKI